MGSVAAAARRKNAINNIKRRNSFPHLWGWSTPSHTKSLLQKNAACRLRHLCTCHLNKMRLWFLPTLLCYPKVILVFFVALLIYWHPQRGQFVLLPLPTVNYPFLTVPLNSTYVDWVGHFLWWCVWPRQQTEEIILTKSRRTKEPRAHSRPQLLY